jgi:hypothetical protein
VNPTGGWVSLPEKSILRDGVATASGDSCELCSSRSRSVIFPSCEQVGDGHYLWSSAPPALGMEAHNSRQKKMCFLNLEYLANGMSNSDATARQEFADSIFANFGIMHSLDLQLVLLESIKKKSQTQSLTLADIAVLKILGAFFIEQQHKMKYCDSVWKDVTLETLKLLREYRWLQCYGENKNHVDEAVVRGISGAVTKDFSEEETTRQIKIILYNNHIDNDVYEFITKTS